MDKFEDLNQKVVCIPFNPTADEKAKGTQVYSPFEDRDLADGKRLRMNAYRAAWDKCLNRVQSIMKALRSPVVSDVMDCVANVYTDVLHGLPFCEVPVFCVSDYTSDGLIMLELIEQFGNMEDADALFGGEALTFVTLLEPARCSNVMHCMRALVTGFVDSTTGPEGVKRRPSTSLANYDMNMLKAWYEAVQYDRDKSSLLVVILNNFEQFDPVVIQDLFYISSLHVPQLPLVFIVSFSSLQSSQYLRQTYPRSTLSLLKVHSFSTPHGPHALEEILTKTFLDIDFEPDILIGPEILDYIVDHFGRCNSGLDAVLTNLQVAHMKHFEDPLSVFVQDSLLGTAHRSRACSKLCQPESFAFLDSVLARLHNSSGDPSFEHASNWKVEDVNSLLDTVDVERQKFTERSLLMKLWFRSLGLVQSFLLQNGHRSTDHSDFRGLFRLMIAVLRGEAKKDIHLNSAAIRKLPLDQIRMMLTEMRDLFSGMPVTTAKLSARTLSDLMSFIAGIPENEDRSDVGGQIADSVGQWLHIQWTEYLVSPEDAKLWDIWYTGQTPFPSELINPSTRASVLSGLLQPWSYVEPRVGENQEGLAIWQLPDTSILFRLYLDAGKMINVYDWFEAFVMTLETQREQTKRLQEATQAAEAAMSAPPKRKRAKKRAEPNQGKEKGTDAANGGKAENADVDVQDENWKVEVQARFVRALHELDYLGFIKHTGRKADHVLRTVFEVPD